MTCAGGLTAGKDFILSLINVISLTTFGISATLPVSISLSSLWSLKTSFGCLCCFVEACFLGCKMALPAVSVKVLPYFGGRTGKRGKCPYPPSILSGRNGHILRKPSVPYHRWPRNQEYHTFHLNLADFVKHTLKGTLLDKFRYLSFTKDIWQNYIFFSWSDIVGKFCYVGKQTASSLAQRNFKLLMCFCENME